MGTALVTAVVVFIVDLWPLADDLAGQEGYSSDHKQESSQEP